MVLMRHEIGDVLRDFRQQKGATLQLATNNPVPVGPDPCPAAKNAKGIPTAQIVIASRLIPRKRTLSAIFDETQ